jgi:triacylglycerol esterase/lipase EstA (alpha/beta hydrolase family)
MLARLQRLIALCLLGVVFGAIGLALRFDAPALWAVPGIIVLGYAAALATEFGLLRRSYDAGDLHRPTLKQLMRAWAAEILGSPRVFLWRQPFRSNAEPDHLPVDHQGHRGVLFVHGFVCNRGLWNPWLRRLRATGVPFVAVNLEPVFGSIDSYAPTVDAAVRSLEQATGVAPVIVAHSMGGLAVRAWLAGEQRSERFHRVVTIATPHAGTRIADRGFGANMGQMRPGGEWLARLLAEEPAALRERFVCFWSHCDNIVFPTRNATLAGADNRHLAATPHVQMAYHPAVFDAVSRLLEGQGRPDQLH